MITTLLVFAVGCICCFPLLLDRDFVDEDQDYE